MMGYAAWLHKANNDLKSAVKLLEGDGTTVAYTFSFIFSKYKGLKGILSLYKSFT